MPPSDLPPPDELLRHAAFVRAVAHAALRGDDAVDDVVQETWLAALGARPRDPSRLRAWLAGIARRQAANRRRREARRSSRERRAARPDAAPSPHQLVERADVGRALVAAVLAMEEPYRGAVLLRYHEGLSPREVAKLLDVPLETARTRIRRGLARLRRRLDETSGGDRRVWTRALLPLASGAGLRALPLAGAGGALVGKYLATAALVLGILVVAWLAMGRGAGGGSRPAATGPTSVPLEGGAGTTSRGHGLAQGPALRGLALRDVMALRGRVRSAASGLPVSEAIVQDAASRARTRTDDLGLFLLRVPRRGRHVLSVEKPGFERAEVRMAPEAASDSVRLDIRLERDLRLRCQVARPSGVPVAGATVYVLTRPGLDLETVPAAPGTTDETGRLSLPWPRDARRVPIASVFLVARDDAGGWGFARPRSPFGNPVRVVLASEVLRVCVRPGRWPADGPAHADVTAWWGPSVDLPGGDGFRMRPVKIASVRVGPRDARGRVLSVPGDGTVLFSARFAQPGWSAGDALRGATQQVAHGARSIEVALSPRRRAPGPEATFTAEISVQVASAEDGAPIPGAQVRCLSVCEDGSLGGTAGAVTDARGHAHFRANVSRRTRTVLRALHPEYHAQDLDLGVLHEDESRGSLRLALIPGARRDCLRLALRGPGGARVDRARIWLLSESGYVDGVEELLAAVRGPGTHVLRISAEERERLADAHTGSLVLDADDLGVRTISLDDLLDHVGSPSPLALELAPPRVLQVHVRDADGRPLPWCRLEVPCKAAGAREYAGPTNPERFTDATGTARIEIRNEGADDVWIVARHPVYGSCALRCRATATGATIDLPGAWDLRGRVLDAHGDAVGGAYVVATPDALGSVYVKHLLRSATTATDGSFTLGNLVRGLPLVVRAVETREAGSGRDVARGVLDLPDPPPQEVVISLSRP